MERVGTGHWGESAVETTGGCIVELSCAVECQPEGEWVGIGLYMAVATNIAVAEEGRAVMELTQGVVHAVLQQVLKEEEQH